MFIEKFDYEVTDFDKNGTLDILLQKGLSQSNPSYYLFLSDSNAKSLNRVKDFEQLYTPSYDSANKTVISYKRVGNEFVYNFYKIKGTILQNSNEGFKVLNDENVDSLYNSAIMKMKNH